MSANIDIVRAGLDAYKRGDYGAVAEVMAPDIRWEGVGDGEACVNRDETLAALQESAEQARGLELADAVPFGTDKVMVCLVRTQAPESGEELPSRLYNVVTFAGEKIVRMQGFLGRKEAVQAARGGEAPRAETPKPEPKQGSGRTPWRRFRMAVGRALGR